MSIMEVISPYHRKMEHDEHIRLTLESSSVEWMKMMRDLTDQTLQADITFEQDGSDVAFDAYLKKVGEIDERLGDTAELAISYVATHGHRAYDKKGYATDGSDDVYSPHEIDVVTNALTIYKTLNKHFPSENAQALLEALIAKYDGVSTEYSGINNRLWAEKIQNVNKEYEALLRETDIFDDSAVTVS